MSNLKFTIYSAIIIILFVLTIYAMSSKDIIFARVETGNIRFVKNGDSFWDIIHDVRGKKFNYSTSSFEPGVEIDNRAWITRELGIYFIGAPWIHTMHKFDIDKQKENPDGETPDKWLTESRREEVDSLWYEIPRAFVFRNIEIGTISQVNIRVTCKFRVVNPIIPVFVLKGDFFRVAESIIEAEVTDVINEYDSIQKFIQAPKKEEGGILSDLKKTDSSCNNSLREQTGLELFGINISKFDPGNKDIIAAGAKEEIAKLEGKAIETMATAKANARKTEAEAEEYYLKTTTKAEIETAVEAFKGTGANADKVAKGVMEFLRTKNIGKSTTITTYVEKGNGTTKTV